MIEYDVIEETPITIAEAKEVMKKVSVKEQTFEQKHAKENAKKMSKLSAKEAESMKKELAALNMRKLKDDNIIKIIDIMPKTPEEIGVVLLGSKTLFNKDETESILEIVKKYAKG